MRTPLLVLSLFLGACSSTCSGNGDGKESGATAAYFSTMNGLVKLEDGVVTTFEVPGVMHNLSIAPDGSLYAIGPLVHVVRNGAVKDLGRAHLRGHAAPDGKLWLTALEDYVEIVDGDERSKISTPAPAQHVIVTTDGTAFIATKGGVYRRQGEEWVLEREAALGNEGWIHGLAAGAKGKLYVISTGGVLLRDPSGAWTRLELGEFPEVIAFGPVSPRGILPLATRTLVRLVQPDGSISNGPTTTPEEVTAIAIDGQDRIWLGGYGGLAVYSLKNELIQSWPAGALASAPAAIVVHGDGPRLPEQAPPAIVGSIQGILMVGEEPLANAAIELCGHLTIEPGASSLCEKAPLRLTARTDAQGAFSLPNVPRYQYALAYERDGEFQYTSALQTSCCSALRQGEVKDVGVIKLRP